MSLENQLLIRKHSIKNSPDFTALLKEIFVAIESALLSADYIAQHEVVASMSFNLLITHLNDAAVALSKIDYPNLSQIDAPLPPHPTIFPCEDAAKDVVVKLEIGPEFAYRIVRDGGGRAQSECTSSSAISDELFRWLGAVAKRPGRNIPRSTPATFEARSDRTKSFNDCDFRSVVDCQELFCKLDKHCLEAAREPTRQPDQGPAFRPPRTACLSFSSKIEFRALGGGDVSARRLQPDEAAQDEPWQQGRCSTEIAEDKQS